jgi:hypothetical protein
MKTVKQAPQLSNFGAVSLMHMPDRWQEEDQGPVLFGQAASRVFRPPQTNVGGLFLRLLPMALNGPTQKSWLFALSGRPRKLAGQQLAELEDVLRWMLDPAVFAIESAKTADLNGKRVLAIRGVWLEHDFQVLSFFLDTTGKGDFVQEIYYGAPTAQYEEWLPAARAAFATIIWHSN